MSLADELDGHAGKISGLASNIQSTTSGVPKNAGWSGSAADGYLTFSGGVGRGSTNIKPPLTNVASAVRDYAKVLKTAQENARAAQAQGGGAPSGGSGEPPAGAPAPGNTELDGAAEETKGTLDKAKEALSSIWEDTEPVRKWIEKLHAPWDALAADSALDKLIKSGETVTQAVEKWTSEEMPEMIDGWFSKVSSLAHDAENGLASWDDVDKAAASFMTKVDAAKAFTKDWAADTGWIKGATGAGKILSRLAGGTALVGDLGTMISPEDKGTMGWVDRGAAGVNAGLVAANLATDEIPVVGEVTMIGTGVYLGGNYLYHHWPWFHNTCNTVGHAVGSAATATGHAIGDAADSVGHAAKKVWDWL